uniref:Uncharacterized protein n=1 Tax=Aegilops tauschii subsp. strangulata TaxID=200361 RepID=A0A453CRU6_AEGTS
MLQCYRNNSIVTEHANPFRFFNFSSTSPFYVFVESCPLFMYTEVDGGSKKSASFLKPMGTISKKKVQLHLKIKKDKRKARKKGNSGKKSY